MTIKQRIKQAFMSGARFRLNRTKIVSMVDAGEDVHSQIEAVEVLDEECVDELVALLHCNDVPLFYHNTDQPERCWCQPEMTSICGRCNGRGIFKKKPCHLCGSRGRLVVGSVKEADNIRHRRVPGKEM